MLCTVPARAPKSLRSPTQFRATPLIPLMCVLMTGTQILSQGHGEQEQQSLYVGYEQAAQCRGCKGASYGQVEAVRPQKGNTVALRVRPEA